MINRVLLVAVCVVAVFSGGVASGQYSVAAPVPAVVYRPVPVMVPAVTVYQPVVPAYAPVVAAYPPLVAYRPMVVPPPVVYGAPPVVYAGPPAVVRPRVYIPGQPVRNVLRAVTP